MNEVTLLVPNAILFLFDWANDAIEVPDYVPGQITSANVSCVSINTRAGVDGDVTVRLGEILSPLDKAECTRYFEHLIYTPSHRVAVVTSEHKRLLELEVLGEKTQLNICVDDPDAPSLICIEAH